jgi:hypothetical protein
MALWQRDNVASSAQRSGKDESGGAPEIERRWVVKNMAANKTMRLTAACGARSFSARREAHP